MVLGGRSLFTVAFDARQRSLWTGAIDRVQGVLVWSRPLCSGSSPRTSGMCRSGGTMAWQCGQIQA
eukprot:scaffold103956_cov35-Phaeocystis_antarctica.AAC.1